MKRIFKQSRAFTLLELLSVIVIIAILAVLLMPALQQIRSRVEKANCIENLRQLYIGTNSYIQDHGHWPQISVNTSSKLKLRDFDEAFIEALIPYHISRSSWICPTTQRIFNNPDYNQPANYRSDYTAMRYDSKAITPHRWPSSPWFLEKGDVHGNGQLIIFTDGSVLPAKEVRASASLPN